MHPLLYQVCWDSYLDWLREHTGIGMLLCLSILFVWNLLLLSTSAIKCYTTDQTVQSSFTTFHVCFLVAKLFFSSSERRWRPHVQKKSSSPRVQHTNLIALTYAAIHPWFVSCLHWLIACLIVFDYWKIPGHRIPPTTIVFHRTSWSWWGREKKKKPQLKDGFA